MRRAMIAAGTAVMAVLALAAPASAQPEHQLIIGHDDGSFEVESVPGATLASAIARAERGDGVAYAEADLELHATAEVFPDDPIFPQQWAPQLVGAPAAWGHTTGDSSVVVAVVDTGVDASQPDLQGAVLKGKSFITGGADSDPNGHGTGVAGVVAARGNNGTGVAGYCWECKILPVRVLDKDGGGSVSTVASGIKWATDNGADIINLSMAGAGTSDTLDSAVEYARSKGVIVIAAAGNQDPKQVHQDLTVPQYPAAAPGVIGVAATDQFDTVYRWSFRGDWNDLAGPGCAQTTEPNGAFGEECGTSFASPAIAGVLGLAMAAAPSVPRDELVDLLLATTSPIASGVAANGRLDAAAFLDTLMGTTSSAVDVDRVAGADRVLTAVELSKRAHPDGAPAVVLARADSYADALAAAPLADKLDAPVLLTPSGGLTSAVLTELQRLSPGDAWLAGGTAALSPVIESQLGAAGVGAIHRIAGANRYDTARQIAEQVGGTSVFITSASAWPDAVAVSGLAAAQQAPILLVNRDSVPTATTLALAALQATSVTVVGGTGVISNGVVNQLGATRLAGATRYETSLAIAQAAVEQGFSAAQTWVATGSDWPDALAAGPASAASEGILVLVDGHSALVTPSLTTWLAGTSDLVVVGGEASVTGLVGSILTDLTGS